MTIDSTQSRLGLEGADAAMIRAGEAAKRIAAQTGTPIAVWQNGRVVLVPVAALPIPAPAPEPASIAPAHPRPAAADTSPD
jgi:hypothetical protein